MLKFLLLIGSCFFLQQLIAQSTDPIYSTRAGEVYFISNAPLERIEARSTSLQGAINVREKKFAFQVNVQSFEGFNSKLQREHFNENYLDSNVFPKAYFSGKFVNDIDLSLSGEYKIRAKGDFFIHGVKQERIIEGKIIVDAETIKIKAFFTVLLGDHNISIPKIVTQKISENIEVWVDATLELRR